jgi:hypothetical protein
LNKLVLKDEELDDVVLLIEEFINLKEGEALDGTLEGSYHKAVQ